MSDQNSAWNDLVEFAKGYQSFQTRLFTPTVPLNMTVAPPPIPPPPIQAIPVGGSATPRAQFGPAGAPPPPPPPAIQRLGDPGGFSNPSNTSPGPYGMGGFTPPRIHPIAHVPPPPPPPPPVTAQLGAPHMRTPFGLPIAPSPQFGAPNPFMRGFDAALDRGQDMQALAMMSQADRMRYGGQLAAGAVANRFAAGIGTAVGGGIGYVAGGGGGAVMGSDIGSAIGQIALTRPLAQSQLLQRSMGALYRPSIDVLANGAQLQLATRSFVSQGSELDISGRGLSSRASMRVARGLDQLSMQSGGRFNQQDMQNITMAGIEENLFDSAQSSDQLLKNVKRVSSMLGMFAKLTGDPDFRSNIRLMGQLKSMGVDLQNQTTFLARMSGNASMAGKTLTEAVAAAQPQAAMFQQAGLLEAQGLDAGIFGQGLAAQMARSGGMSRAQRTRLGGTAGMAQRFAEIQQQQLAGGLDAFLPYLTTRGSDGKLTIDQERLSNFRRGGISMNEMLSQGAAGMDSRTLQDLVNNIGDLRVQLAEKLGPSGSLVATLKNVERVQQQLGGPSNASFQTAARSMGLSADAASQLEGLRNDPQAIQGIMQQQQAELRRLRYEDQQSDSARRARRRTQFERGRDSLYNTFMPFQNDVQDAYNDMQADFQRSVDASMEDARLGALGLRAQRRDGGVDRLLEDRDLNRSALFESGLRSRRRGSPRAVGGRLFNALMGEQAATGIAMTHDYVTTGDMSSFLYGQNSEQAAIHREFAARGTFGVSQFISMNPRSELQQAQRDLNRIGNAAIDVKAGGAQDSARMRSETEAALDKAGIKDPATRQKIMASVAANLAQSTRSNSSLLSGRRALQFNELESAVDTALSEAGVSDPAARQALLSDQGQRGLLSNFARMDTRGIESIEKTADSASKMRNATDRREYSSMTFKESQSALQGIAAKYGMGGMFSSKLSVNEQEAIKMVHAARKDKSLPGGEGAAVLVLLAVAIVDGEGEITADHQAIRTYSVMLEAASKESSDKARALQSAFDRYSARLTGMYADRSTRPTVVAISKLKADSIGLVDQKDASGKTTHQTFDLQALNTATEEVAAGAAIVSRGELTSKTRNVFRGTKLQGVGQGDLSFADDLRKTVSQTTNKDEQKKIIDALKRNNASPQVIGALERAFESNDPNALDDAAVTGIAEAIMGEGGKNITSEGGTSTKSAATKAAEADSAELAFATATTNFQASVERFGQFIDQQQSRSAMDTLVDVTIGNPLNPFKP